jgi:hypothetical protein
MDPTKNDLGTRLLAQQVSDPEKRARYQKEVDAMLEKFRREAWWMELVHAAIVVLFTIQLFFGGGILVYCTFRLLSSHSDFMSFVVLVLGWFLFFLAASALLWHLNRRMRLSDILVQLKGVDMRVLKLEELRNAGADK